MTSNVVEIPIRSDDDTEKGIKSAERRFEGLSRTVKGVAEKAGTSLGKVGGKLTDGLKDAFKAGPMVALGVGAGIGGLLIGGITKALDKGAIQAKLAAQLGLAGADAKKFGDAAADLYKSGWGESIQETADITKAAFENGLVSVRTSREEIKKVGEQVAVYAELTGEDAVASTRAVAQMIKNGLAKNATEAFDILVRGQQLGINKSEDLLDTFNEYGTQFRKLGLSADDALGLMNQMLQGGARDADTAADAIKEFSIRAIDGSTLSAEGFKALGLNAEEMTKKLAAGGPTARTAFGDILDGLNALKDPVAREAAGVALFGTKWEDLGAAVSKADLDTAAGSLGKVADATQRVNDALSATPAAKIESLRRRLEQTFVDLFVKHALPAVTRFVDWLSGPGIYKISEWALAGTEAVVGFALKFLDGLDTMLSGVENWGKWTLRAMASTFAVFNPTLAKSMWDASNRVGDWSKESRKSIDNARDKLQQWNRDVSTMKKEAKLKADISDLQAKLNTAQAELRNPNLTKERRAKLNADIAALKARIDEAQGKINNLRGKTVAIRYVAQGRPILEGRAGGGTVRAGTPYVVGEREAEVFVPDQNGRILPSVSAGRMASGGSPTIIHLHIGTGSRFVKALMEDLRKQISIEGGDVQVVLGP